MKTYLVTGAAGFIGSNFIKYLLYKKYKEEEIKIIVLDLLTYAGNYGTIKRRHRRKEMRVCARRHPRQRTGRQAVFRK